MTAPAIPASCAHRPTVGGLVAPYVNIRLADGGVDFRSPHQKKFGECFTKGLCQTCGNPTGRMAVLFGGPNQIVSGRFDEPPLCPPCAQYASKACPMVAGRQTHYAARARLAEGVRGHVCATEGCDCGGLVPSDPNFTDHGGDPAHTWYAAFIRRGTYTVTVHNVPTYCSDGLCDQPHDRIVVNGCQLNTPPMKVFLVSEPGAGRIWRRLTPGEVASIEPLPVHPAPTET